MRKLFLLACVFFAVSCVKKETNKEMSFFAMGTLVTVTLPANSAHEFKNVSRLIRSLSDEVAAETDKINSGSGKKQISPLMCDILKSASEYRKISGGKFNVAVYTLLKLYGFPEGDYREVSLQEKSQALKTIQKGISLFVENGVCYADGHGALIDTGAISKGTIVDKTAAYLHSKGIEDFIINAGGDLYASGSKNGSKWRLGIRDPFDKSRVSKVVELSNKALATSGTYERYFITDSGEKISHLVNALNGEQGNKYISISVVADTTEKADALATVYFFMDRDEIKSRCSLDNVQVTAITNDGSILELCQ